jgi:pyruvate dehydrogenase E1 component alpha subunit
MWKLPIVFVLDNNLYAEYSRIDLTTPIADLHIRAASYAMESAVVDGMEVGAVTEVIGAAVDRARNGGGPTLVEAKTYRFAGHSRADTAPYRPEGELDQWQARDPLRVTRAGLVAAGHADEQQLDEVEQRVKADLGALVDRVSAMPGPDVTAMFDNIWSPRAS